MVSICVAATGISNYLIGAKEADDIIRQVSDHPNLYIIPCGPIPPNPSELIVNGRIQELLADLDKKFDYIIIDTCPVGPVTDAYLISPMIDATLYVVRHGKTPKTAIQKLDDQNKIHSLKNRAIVFNGVKQRGFKAYGSSSAYGYSYGTAYGEDSASKKRNKRTPSVEN